MAARAFPAENAIKEPFKVVYVAPTYGRKKAPEDCKDKEASFKYRLPTYDYDKVMSRVKPMMMIHDRPPLELEAQARKENINFVKQRAQQTKRFREASRRDRPPSSIPKVQLPKGVRSKSGNKKMV